MQTDDSPISASPDVERLLDSIDFDAPADDTAASDDSADDQTDESADESTEDSTDEEVESDEKDDTTEEVESEEGDSEADEESEDEGYTIDGDEEPVEEEVPTNSTDENKTNPNLTPEQSYILENLQPITVRGIVDDKPVEVKVFSPEQLPAGFKYNDDRERSIYDKAYNMLEGRAQELQSEYRNQENNKASQQFQAAEEAADRADIGELQRNGEIPRFKASPDAADFEEDAGVQLVQEILDFKDAENQRYLEESQKGKPYRHIGFREAFYSYKSRNPSKARSPEQTKEDSERKAVARRTSRTQGTSTKSAAQKPEVFKSTRDMMSYIDGLDF